jgi:hypothetical protein
MTRNYLPILVTLLFLFTNILFAQHTVKGKLVSETNEPVAFANVILLNAEDSTSVYKGTISEDNGEFLLEEIEANDYLLKVSFVGYEEHLQQISINSNKKLGRITLSEGASNLDEVTINARKPKITRSIDRITFDVENSTLSTTNSYEILKRTPGVIASQGQLLVNNTPATVYINDRKVYLTTQELQQLLEGFSGENIKSVEVITNPPARYDAEGGAILNIKTSKNISIGYKGSVNASNTIAIVPKYNIGTSQYYKNNWVNVFASYNFNSRYDYKNDLGFIEFYEPNGSVDSRWKNDFERNTRTFSHNLNTILDFTLTDNSSLSLSANIQHTPKADSDIGGLTEIYNPQNQLDSLFTTDSRLENERDNILLSANYNTEIGEQGASLSAVANYIDYNDNQTQNLKTEYFGATDNLINTNSFYTIANQNSQIFTGKVDFSSPWKGTNIETGLKYSLIETESGLDFFDTNTGSEIIDALSDNFDYIEDIYAAYFSFEKDWNAWSIKAGLRGEYTNVNGISSSQGAVNAQEYFQLFPTFYLLNSAADNYTYGLDYSRRIIRPRFESLNPYRYFLNENNFNEGNPNLRPAISNKINFNYTFKNKLSFDLYWERTENAMAVLPFQNNQERFIRSVNANMDFQQQYSLDVTYYNYVKDWWYLYLYGSFFYMQADFFALENAKQIVTNDVYSTYLMAQNFFTFSKDGTFSGELIANYLPNYISGSYSFDDPQYGISVGLRKSFFENRLITTLNVDDIFNTQNIPMSSQYLNQNNGFFAMPESRMLRLGLIYKFGNFKLSDNKRALDVEENSRVSND